MKTTPSTLEYWWQASLPPQQLTRQWAFVLWLGTFLVFAAHGAWPTPDSNEAHYLGKARHTWDSTWCAGDLFLESRDFHKTFGWDIWLGRETLHAAGGRLDRPVVGVGRAGVGLATVGDKTARAGGVRAARRRTLCHAHRAHAHGRRVDRRRRRSQGLCVCLDPVGVE